MAYLGVAPTPDNQLLAVDSRTVIRKPSMSNWCHGAARIVSVAAFLVAATMPLSADELRISIEVKGANPPQEVWIEVTPSGPGAKTSRLEVLVKNGQSETSVEVSGDVHWHLQAGADGFWSSAAEVARLGVEVLELVEWLKE